MCIKQERGQSKFTVIEVADRFEEAVCTLRRLPKVKVQQYFNAMPDVVHSAAELLQAEKEKMKLPPPSASSISRMDECFQWILWLEKEEERRIVWLRAERVYWKQICGRVGFSRTKAWEIYTIALLKIVTLLNSKQNKELHVRTKKD